MATAMHGCRRWPILLCLIVARELSARRRQVVRCGRVLDEAEVLTMVTVGWAGGGRMALRSGTVFYLFFLCIAGRWESCIACSAPRSSCVVRAVNIDAFLFVYAADAPSVPADGRAACVLVAFKGPPACQTWGHLNDIHNASVPTSHLVMLRECRPFCNYRIASH